MFSASVSVQHISVLIIRCETDVQRRLVRPLRVVVGNQVFRYRRPAPQEGTEAYGIFEAFRLVDSDDLDRLLIRLQPDLMLFRLSLSVSRLFRRTI